MGEVCKESLRILPLLAAEAAAGAFLPSSPTTNVLEHLRHWTFLPRCDSAKLYDASQFGQRVGMDMEQYPGKTAAAPIVCSVGCCTDDRPDGPALTSI